MKFPVRLPLTADAEGQSYLQLQAWDLDVVFNDCVAETDIDLAYYFDQAYKRYRKVRIIGDG